MRFIFFQFDSTSVVSHYHASLKMLSKDTVHYDKLLVQYMSFIVEFDETLVALQGFHPRLLWGQSGARFRELVEVLINFYRTPAWAPVLNVITMLINAFTRR